MKYLVRYILLIVVAIAVGAVPAYFYHQLETQNDEVFFNDDWTRIEGESPVISVAGGTSHSFGAVSSDEPCSCEFVIQNNGDATLKIWRETSGDVIQSDLTEKPVSILAGSSFPIAFSFDSKNMSGEFNESVTIQTNDTAHGNETFSFNLTGKVE